MNINALNRMNVATNKKGSMFSFYIIVFYLFLEFVRPQTLIPGLAVLHLPAVTIAIIIIYLFSSGNIYLKDKQTVSFLLIITEMVIHGPIAINNYWAFNVFYLMVINFIAFLGISRVVDDEVKYKKFISYYLMIFIFLSVMGLMSKGRGIGGFLGDENDFCMVLNMALPFALYRVFSTKSGYGKAYYIALSGLILLANVVTVSRGGFLGLAAVLLYCGVRSKNKMALAALFSLLIIFVLVFAPPAYWKEVESISSEPSNTQGTGAQRIYAWKLGWEMFLDNPILGVGQGNYPWHVVGVEKELNVQWEQRSLGGRAAHSAYFTLLPELGLIGVLLYGSFLYYMLKDIKYIKNIAKEKAGVFSPNEVKLNYNQALTFEASLIGFLVTSIFISTLYYPAYYILAGFVLSYKNILQSKVLNSSTANVILPIQKIAYVNTVKHE
jgi:O-antigen ligase